MARRHDHLRLGAHGEALVARRYEREGYRVLARNWRCAVGELDLVLARGDLVVVCEVKTRASARFGSGLEAVGPDKQRRLRRLAAIWVATAAPFRPGSVRIDVAAVTAGRLEVVEGAC
ncbi:MAG: YraN family protein [Microthrixaceae bacterium]